MKLSAIRRAAFNPRNFVYNPPAPYSMQFAGFFFALTVSYFVGDYLDRQEQNRMTRFRDKSALFGKELGPDDPPSWGDKEYKWNVSKWNTKWY